MTPVRIQRRRTKGWVMPENTVYVGRGSRWGNPYSVGDVLSKGPHAGAVVVDTGHAVTLYRAWAIEAIAGRALPDRDGITPTADEVKTALRHLRGKNLACWCPIINSHGEYSPCHADVLLSLANDIPLEEIICENTRRAKGQAL